MNAHLPIYREAQSQYDYPTAFAGWGPEEYDAMQRVIASGRFTMGEQVEAFEAEFAAWHGMEHAIMVNSGSSANLIAVAALFARKDSPLMRGDKVLVPALAWATTFAPLIQHGLEPILLDAGSTWNAEGVWSGTRPDMPRLILACSILGNAQAFMADGAYAIEDNCESIGAKSITGDLAGTRGIGNTFSFFWSHQLSAIEGGCILTNDAEYANLCRMLRNHGWTRGVYHSRTFGSEYEFQLFGYNVRPVEMHAAIAREQLKKLDARIAVRRENFTYWRDFASQGLPLTHPVMVGEPSPFGIHFCVESSAVRTRLAAALRAAGIDCRPPVGGSFRKQPYGARWADQQTPNADRIHDTGMMLGNAPYPIHDKIDRAVLIMSEVL